MVNPALHSADLPKSKHGALQVSDQLQVLNHPDVFALGDCAAVPTPDGQGFYFPNRAERDPRRPCRRGQYRRRDPQERKARGALRTSPSGVLRAWASARQSPRLAESGSLVCPPGSPGAASTLPSCQPSPTRCASGWTGSPISSRRSIRCSSPSSGRMRHLLVAWRLLWRLTGPCHLRPPSDDRRSLSNTYPKGRGEAPWPRMTSMT